MPVVLNNSRESKVIRNKGVLGQTFEKHGNKVKPFLPALNNFEQEVSNEAFLMLEVVQFP